MIRLVQRKLIIPRGDTGTFSVPVISTLNTGDVAVFTIIDMKTKRKVYEKIIDATPDTISIRFEHSDTVNLPVGRYYWDIKFYQNPEWTDNELINGTEVDSYYAAYSLPECEIRLTGDNLLTVDDSPTTTITPYYLNVLNATVNDVNHAKTEITELANSANEAATRAQEQADSIKQLSATVTMLDTNDEPTSVYNSETGVLSLGIPAPNSIFGILKTSEDGLVDTYTISYTNGTSTTFTVTNGMIPNLTIGTVQEGATAAASITGTAANPILNLTLPNANVPTKVSQLENDSNYAVDANYVHTDNNYTTAEKNKLSGIAAGAEVNVNADWNANGGDAQILNKPTKVSDFTNDAGYLTEHQDISGKADKSEIPTKVSQLQNDSGYLTSFTETDPTVPAWAKAAQKPSYTAAEVGAPTVAEMNTAIGTAIGQINSFDIAVVQALPAQDISTHTIYLVPKTGETNDAYDEYIYINNAWEMVGNTQIDLSDYALKSELPTKVSELSNDSGYLTSYIETDPTVPQWAKANTKPSYTAVEVGALPSDTHIPSTTAELTNDAGFITVDEVPAVPVQDVQVNGTSVVTDGVANVPIASTSTPGVVKVNTSYGTSMYNGQLQTALASASSIKAGTQYYQPVVPYFQDHATFYGLAKAAGADMKDIANTTVGTYPDAQKAAIQSMFGISQMLAPTNPNLVASQAYAIGDVFAANGHLYKATAAIAQDEAIIPDTNCVETTMVDAGGKIKDVQIEGNSIVGSDGVASIPIASNSIFGATKGNPNQGVGVDSVSRNMYIVCATDIQIKLGAHVYKPIVPSNQNVAVFYGLSKAAGVDLANETVTLGTYPETSKTAIRAMIGATSNNVIAVQDTQPTDPDTKIWLPETAETPVTVPTVAEMEQALAGKVSDVQVNETSVVGQDGVANVPIASASTYGVMRVASDSDVKSGASAQRVNTPYRQHRAVFYGLAKAAGDATQAASDNAVGTYTDDAKSAIQTMLNVIPAPSSPATGAFLVWSGSAWVAQTLSTWQGGNY